MQETWVPSLGQEDQEGTGYPLQYSWASLLAQTVKNLPAMRATWGWSLGWENPLEEELATHSSILVSRLLWTEEPGRPQSKGSQRVGHGWAKHIHSMHTGISIDISIFKHLCLQEAKYECILLSNSHLFSKYIIVAFFLCLSVISHSDSEKPAHAK